MIQAIDQAINDGEATITEHELKTPNQHFITLQPNVINVGIFGLKRRGNVLVRGATGSGKTVFVGAIGDLHPNGKITINCNAEISVEDMKGKYTIKPKEDGTFSVEWLNSLIVEAMVNGYLLIIEEINFIPPELFSVLYSVTDHRRELILNEHTGEVIKAHPDFCVFATMNYGYAGTNEMNPAYKSRFDIIIDVDYLKPKQETQLLIKATGIKEDEAKTIIDTANKLRRNPDLELDDIGTRTLLAWSYLVRSGLSLKDAAEFSIIPFCAATERNKKVIREQIDFFVDRLEAEREEDARAAAKKLKAEAEKKKAGEVKK
jgi:MoxR-like ATPase